MATGKTKVLPGSLTAAQAKGSIIIIAGFLIFGLLFGWTAISDIPDSEDSLRLLVGAFFVLWVAICLFLILFLSKIASRKHALLEIQTPESHDPTSSRGFETRLRELDKLHRDGLISKAEFDAKRQQIMSEKW